MRDTLPVQLLAQERRGFTIHPCRSIFVRSTSNNVPPYTRHNRNSPIPQGLLLPLTNIRSKVLIRLARHQQHLRLDAPNCLSQIPLYPLHTPRHITTLPHPQHSQQVPPLQSSYPRIIFSSHSCSVRTPVPRNSSRSNHSALVNHAEYAFPNAHFPLFSSLALSNAALGPSRN